MLTEIGELSGQHAPTSSTPTTSEMRQMDVASDDFHMDPALTDTGTPNGSKRKATDHVPVPRAKRNRYIPIACNECKRRKVKCNGETPCQRCGSLKLDCVYAPNCCSSSFKDSDEFKQMTAHIESLQQQVDALYANLSSLRSEISNGSVAVDPSLQTGTYSNARPAPVQRQDARTPVFHGPTSIAYTLDVAKSSLKTMGITPDEPTEQDLRAGGRCSSPDGLQFISLKPEDRKDPIWEIPRSEAMRLLKIYEDDAHEMYPVISLTKLRAHTETLYHFVEAMLQSRLARVDKPGADAIHDDDTNILKLALAIALTVEGRGQSAMGQRLFDGVQPHLDAILLHGAGIKPIQLLALATIYNFYVDREATSWRIIGLTARMCMELGLHRKEAYDKLSPPDRDSAILLFWSIVGLDRRWSMGTGMPFALQEADVDSALPRPGDLSPYLSAVIGNADIGSKVWRAVGFEKGGAGSQDVTREDIRYLDYLIREWHRKLPKQYFMDRPTFEKLDAKSVNHGNLRLAVSLYMRQQSLLILIHRPVLYSVAAITRNPGQAQDVVNEAKDTISVLARLNSTTEIYRANQALFNPLLTMSLAVLFLAVSHAPATFAEQVREEYNLALDLVRGFSKDSWIAKRLWKTIRGLKDAAPKLGLARNTNKEMSSHAAQQAQPHHAQSDGPKTSTLAHDDDPSRSAALAMAGLAGHHVDEFALYGNALDQSSGVSGMQYGTASAGTWSTGVNSSMVSPDHMANDLDHLFAAAEAFNGGFDADGQPASYAGLVGAGPGADGEMPDLSGGGLFGNEDELSRIMRDLF